jgi:hypothetical protein
MNHSKYITALAVGMALASSAQAESFFSVDVGLGASRAIKAGDMQYFDEGLPHKTPVDSFAARAGIAATLIDAPVRSWVPGMRLHLTYAYWGRLNWTATVAQDSANFPQGNGGYSAVTKSCIDNNCGQMRTFNSSGVTHSIDLSAEAFWNLGNDWEVGVSAGPAIYFGPWHSTYIANENGVFGPAGSTEQVSHRIVPHLGAVAGLSVSKGNFSLGYSYLYAPPHFAGTGNDVPSGIKGAHMVYAGWRF